MNDYLSTLIVDDMRLVVAVKQGTRKIRDELLLIVVPKAKVSASKLMSTVCGKEVIVKDKL